MESPERKEGDVTAKAAENDADRISLLIEKGEAVDSEDAEASLSEEREAQYLRDLNREEALAEIIRVLEELDRRWGDSAAEPLSEDERFERWELRFQRAIIETAESPDEREFLLYHCYLLDLPPQKHEAEALRARNESIKQRLERKARRVAEQIGEAHSRELVARYYERFQEIFSTY